MAENKRIKLMMAFNRRFDPSFSRLKKADVHIDPAIKAYGDHDTAVSILTFIRAPFTVGNTWTWNHQIAYDSVNYFSSGSLTIPWNATLRNNRCSYEILQKENLIVGDHKAVVECLVGIGYCRNSVHNNSLKYWFNPNIGFLKLVFNNMDGSTIIFNAIDFEVCS